VRSVRCYIRAERDGSGTYDELTRLTLLSAVLKKAGEDTLSRSG